MPRVGGVGGGGLTQYLRALFGQKENFNVYFFTSDLFFPLQSFSRKTNKKKLAWRARVNIERVYRILLMPPVHPIILLKSN